MTEEIKIENLLKEIFVPGTPEYEEAMMRYDIYETNYYFSDGWKDIEYPKMEKLKNILAQSIDKIKTERLRNLKIMEDKIYEVNDALRDKGVSFKERMEQINVKKVERIENYRKNILTGKPLPISSWLQWGDVEKIERDALMFVRLFFNLIYGHEN